MSERHITTTEVRRGHRRTAPRRILVLACAAAALTPPRHGAPRRRDRRAGHGLPARRHGRVDGRPGRAGAGLRVREPPRRRDDDPDRRPRRAGAGLRVGQPPRRLGDPDDDGAAVEPPRAGPLLLVLRPAEQALACPRSPCALRTTPRPGRPSCSSAWAPAWPAPAPWPSPTGGRASATRGSRPDADAREHRGRRVRGVPRRAARRPSRRMARPHAGTVAADRRW